MKQSYMEIKRGLLISLFCVLTLPVQAETDPICAYEAYEANQTMKMRQEGVSIATALKRTGDRDMVNHAWRYEIEENIEEQQRVAKAFGRYWYALCIESQ